MDRTFEPGVLAEHVLAADDAVDHRGDLRAVLDDDVAFASQLVDDVLAGDLAGLDVVGGHRGVGAFGRGVDGNDDDAGGLRLLDRRADRLGIAGVEQDQVDAGGDEIVDLGDLLAEVIFEADGGDLHVGVSLLGLEFGALRQCDEERMPSEPKETPIDLSSFAKDGAELRTSAIAAPANEIDFNIGFLPGLFEAPARRPVAVTK